MKMSENFRDFYSYSSLSLTSFPVAKMPKAQWDRDRNMDTIMEIYVAHGQPHSENKYKPQQQHSSPFLWLALSCIVNTHQAVAFNLLYKHDILQYIVFRFFFLPTPAF